MPLCFSGWGLRGGPQGLGAGSFAVLDAAHLLSKVQRRCHSSHVRRQSLHILPPPGTGGL